MRREQSNMIGGRQHVVEDRSRRSDVMSMSLTGGQT